MNEFGKIAGQKINICKSVAFPYTITEISEREIRKAILSVSTSKRIQMHTALYKIDKQQGTTIQHRELYSISYDYNIK